MKENWGHLAKVVAERRAHLKLSQDAVRAAGGPSDVVLSRIENNDKPHPRGDTLHKLDAPLGWQPGSAVAVLYGGDPTPMSTARLIDDLTDEELLAEIRRRMRGARRGVEGETQSSASAQGRQDQEAKPSSNDLQDRTAMGDIVGTKDPRVDRTQDGEESHDFRRKQV